MKRLAVTLLIGLVLLARAGAPCGDARTAPATDLVAVDEFIDAPRTLFGRTRAAVEQALGAPAAVQARMLPGGRTAATDTVDELTYPGLVIAVSRRSAGVRRVEVREPRWILPRGLNVGATRGRVEQALGEPQAMTDASVLYLYSDAYPDTVEFYFRDGRVHRIEWLYAPPD
ncbi:MAG TPA: hypothetical protein VFV05_10440 [Methylomirabilota bacterium]|nr:hypothetical protein [Methylomirabilota bacterium]